MTDSQSSKGPIEKSGIDISNPHEVMASGKLEDWYKIYLLCYILRYCPDQADVRAACRYLNDLMGNEAMFFLVAVVMYYKETCPEIHFPNLTDIADQLESLFSDKPEQR